MVLVVLAKFFQWEDHCTNCICWCAAFLHDGAVAGCMFIHCQRYCTFYQLLYWYTSWYEWLYTGEWWKLLQPTHLAVCVLHNLKLVSLKRLLSITYDVTLTSCYGLIFRDCYVIRIGNGVYFIYDWVVIVSLDGHKLHSYGQGLGKKNVVG